MAVAQAADEGNAMSRGGITPVKSVSETRPGRGRLRRALGFAFPYRRAVGFIFVVTLALAGINAAEPLVLKYIFDGLTSPRGARTLLQGIGVMVGLSIFREIATAYS